MSARTIVSGIFLFLVLLTGILCFRDYGINWDEPVHQWRGQAVLDYILKGDRRLIDSEIQRSYGPFPDIILAAVERAFGNPPDTRSLYLSRRLMLFLIFYLGVVFFFLLGKKIYQSWIIGLLGSLFLVLSPRIFAHSFHNAKDIPLMAAMVIAFYTLVRYIEKPSGGRLAVHALACAVATEVRIIGILSFCLTGAAFLFLIWENRKEKTKVLRFLKQAAVFGPLYIALIVLLWPTLWENPVGRFIDIIHFSTNLPWGGMLLYGGQFFRDGELPWHYIPVWIAVSTPLLYLGLSVLGVFGFFTDFIGRRRSGHERRIPEYLILLWFFVPPLLTILFQVHTFDEWRHLFYIYPALLLIGLGGLSTATEAARKFLPAKNGLPARFISAALVLIILGGTVPVALFMVRNHPHENIYFNRLAGRDMAAIGQKFELDYWGNSYKQGLEYILRMDPRKVITVAVDNRPGEFNAMILPRDERRRLVCILPLALDIAQNPEIQSFVDRHPGRYSLRAGNDKLIIRGRMTPGEREELLEIFQTPMKRQAVEKTYQKSQALETADYFLTNYRLHPDEFPLEKVHSIKVGTASILGIYRLTPQRPQNGISPD